MLSGFVSVVRSEVVEPRILLVSAGSGSFWYAPRTVVSMRSEDIVAHRLCVVLCEDRLRWWMGELGWEMGDGSISAEAQQPSLSTHAGAPGRRT